MPPKFKFTRDQIIDACFELARTNGLKAVTARGVAAKLGSSSKVLYSSFSDMDDVENAVIERAKEYYKTYVDEGLKDPLPFKGVGEKYIQFAKKEPKLFNILFMQEVENSQGIFGAMHVDDNYDRILRCVETSYGLNATDAVELYRCMWVVTHGIAVLIATKTCNLQDDEINDILHTTIMGVLHQLKNEK